mgnify:CR=1 FL=1
MRKILFIVLAFFWGIETFGQIDMTDSTVKVVSYWGLNEKQSYIVTEEKYKVKDNDTTSREFSKYSVDITVVDSTANSYIVDWFYKDYEIKTDNELVKKVMSIAEDMTVKIKTDELGVFQEVINWKEIRDYMLKATKVLIKETQNIPNMDKFIKQIEGVYGTKASIEAAAIKEIQQFHTFHGASYKLGQDYFADMKLANLYGGEPFDAKVAVWLDEINPVDNNYVIRMEQTVDSIQLTNATFEYLSKMSETLKIPLPKKEEIPTVKNTIWTASRIHGTGWVIFSVETKETESDGIMGVEERKIEIQ